MYVCRLVVRSAGDLIGYEFMDETHLGAENKAKVYADICGKDFGYVQTVRVSDRAILDIDENIRLEMVCGDVKSD